MGPAGSRGCRRHSQHSRGVRRRHGRGPLRGGQFHRRRAGGRQPRRALGRRLLVRGARPRGITVFDVIALAVFDGELYVGGHFSIGGQSDSVLRFDGATWSRLTGPSGTGINLDVRAFEVFDDGTGPALYLGGSFTTGGGMAAQGMARWDGAAWSPMPGVAGAGGGLGSVGPLAVFSDAQAHKRVPARSSPSTTARAPACSSSASSPLPAACLPGASAAGSAPPAPRRRLRDRRYPGLDADVPVAAAPTAAASAPAGGGEPRAPAGGRGGRPRCRPETATVGSRGSGPRACGGGRGRGRGVPWRG